MLDAWREQGADRMSPMRFRRIDALARRAAAHGGEVRRLLDGRLAELIGAYAGDLEQAASKTVGAGAASADACAGAGLSSLVDYIADRATLRDGLAIGGASSGASFPELGVLDEFRTLWSKLRVESQLRQSLEQSPANAGPLNSGRLVHRSLTLMSELSPGYLQQFLAYVDALTWIEQMSDSGLLALEDTQRSGSGGGSKRVREKPRKRRE
ncbi:DUF2894 domain-containing protein [Lysobacter antibioticus]|uniref:DUF2894 domain-containing protein n=1 Tax=Lysobacter antibioticus TaxID=84531 RepID=UPI0006902FCE|nr:DUF2894 domain-containing protein [Lysobacter antibioticus]